MSEPTSTQIDNLSIFFSEQLPRAIRGVASTADEQRRETATELGTKIGAVCSGHGHSEVILALMILMNLTFEDMLWSVAAPTTKAIN